MITILVLFFLVFFFFHPPLAAGDGFTLDNAGISKVHQSSIPHIAKNGTIQQSHTTDSFIPIAMWGNDFGRYDSYNWNYYQLNDNISRDTTPNLVEAGFNAVFTHVSNDIMALLQDRNLKAFYGVYWSGIWQYEKGDTNWDTLKTTINKLKNHPTTIGYYLYDEPDNVPDFEWSTLQKAYQIIKAIDPNRPIFANFIGGNCDAPSITSFNNTAVADFYPFHHTGDSTEGLGDNLNFLNCFGQSKETTPFFPILQAYSGGRETNPTIIPTKQQMRNQIYLALTRGATGFWLFTHHDPWRLDEGTNKCRTITWTQPCEHLGGISKEFTPEIWNEVIKINTEINTYKKIILSKTAADVYDVYLKYYGRTEHPIKTILKNANDGDSRYLLAVSTATDYVQSRFEFANNVYAVTSLLDNRTITPSGKTFTDGFTNLDVRLYRIDFSPYATPTSCPTEKTYNDTNPTNIKNYCQAVGLNCQYYPSSISCHSGAGSWTNFGSSCTAPYCNGCACVTPTNTPKPTNTPTKTPTKVPTIPPKKLGDANGDGKVNLLDFGTWKTEYLTKTGLNSDFDKNNKVNIADFAVWKAEYLKTK